MNSAAARICARWVTIEVVMEALQLKDEAVRRLILSGAIYGKKVGKEWRVDLETVEAFLESDRSAAKVALSKFRK
jgi:excisionase family DNA binding protein